MRRISTVLLAALVLAAGTSCYTARVSSPVQPGVKRQTDHGTVWFWGLLRTETSADECRAGLAEVETSTPWYGYIVMPITIGIAHPVKKSYTCALGEGF